MEHSTAPLFDIDELEAGNGLPYEAWRLFSVKYTRATETVLTMCNITAADLFYKVRKKGRSWQKFKFYVKFVQGLLFDCTSPTWHWAFKNGIEASGHQSDLQKALVPFLEGLWRDLDIHYCPKMEVMRLLVESSIKQL